MARLYTSMHALWQVFIAFRGQFLFSAIRKKGAGMQRINWARGSFRIWLILTLIWAGLMFIEERPDEQLSQYLTMRPAIERAEALANAPSDPVTLPSGKISTRSEVASDLITMRERQAARINRVTSYAKSVLIPSLLLLTLGMMLGWAIKGFQKDRIM